MTTTAPDNHPPRITSIDALRGLVMFTMIFVNDLAGAPEKIVPDWMVHFSDRHPDGSGMTFVDLVFPGFLFLVGMSIPFSLGPRLAKGEPLWKIVMHVITRTLGLLTLGILMVNDESAARETPGWSPTLWAASMFVSAILSFCSISPRGAGPGAAKFWKNFNVCVRLIGFAGLIYLAFAFHGRRNQPVITLSPFHINTDWYGILGLIGWAYLAASIVYLVFRGSRTAILGCVALMMCFFAADRNGFFDNFRPNHYVDFGGTLGSQAAISVAGLLLASILVAPDMVGNRARARFTLLFIGGFAFAAMLLNGLYGISKNAATPSWCLWSCAITAALWLIFYYLADVRRMTSFSKPFAVAGQNVLLAYLISEGMESWLDLLHLGDWYDQLAGANLACACARSIGCAAIILAITALLNRLGSDLSYKLAKRQSRPQLIATHFRKKLSNHATSMTPLKKFISAGAVTFFILCSSATVARAGWPARVFAPYMYIGAGDKFKLTDCDDACGLKYYTLAFIIARQEGRGTNATYHQEPSWDGRIPMDQNLYKDQIDAIRQRGGDVIMSFGGEAGKELANAIDDPAQLEAAYQKVIDQYHFTRLDFDVEGNNLDKGRLDSERRNTVLASLQKKNPGLIISYTLPVDPDGLSEESQALLADAVKKGVKVHSANIMVMFFGREFTGKGKSEGQLGIDSANTAYAQVQKIDPAVQIGLCPCLGENGSKNEVFTLDDAKILKAFADKTPWVCSLHYWSINDDAVRPRRRIAAVTNSTNSMTAITPTPLHPWDFANIFKDFTTH